MKTKQKSGIWCAALTVLLGMTMLYACTRNESPEEWEMQIRKDYLRDLNDKNISLSDVYIYSYFGTYGDSVAVKMALKSRVPPPKIDTIVVEGFEFEFNTGLHIVIWNNRKFYSLQAAFDKGFLTLENLKTIHDWGKS